MYFFEDGFSFVVNEVDSVIVADTLQTDMRSSRLDVRFGCAIAEPSSPRSVESVECPTLESFSQVDAFLNYYLPHCDTGITGVRGYEQLSYSGINPYTNAHFLSNAAGPKFFFELEPGADPDGLILQFEGQDSIELIVQTGMLEVYVGEKSFPLPQATAYEVDGSGNVLAMRWLPQWINLGNGEVKLVLGAYDTTRTLMVRVGWPVANPGPFGNNLTWSTYYGSEGQDLNVRVEADNLNNVYVLSRTDNQYFPSQNGELPYKDQVECSFSKFDNGTSIQWATFLGGSDGDIARDLILDKNSSSFYVCGETSSTDFPVLAGSGTFYQGSYGGGNQDAFFGKFNKSNGFRSYLSYFGGDDQDQAIAMALDDNSNSLFLVGNTLGASNNSVCPTTSSSSGFPICAGTGIRYIQGQVQGYYDAFIAEFDVSNLALTWSTFVGGDGQDLAVDVVPVTDNQGNISAIYLAGNTTTTQIPATLTSPLVTTSNGIFPLADPGGNSYVQETHGTFAPFLLRFSGTSYQIEWGTFLGTIAFGSDIAVNSLGDVYMVGTIDSVVTTVSTCNPTTQVQFPICNSNGSSYIDNLYSTLSSNTMQEGFITRFNSSNELIWSTLFGGESREEIEAIFIDELDNIFITGGVEGGDVNSTTIPTTNANFPGYYFQASNSALGQNLTYGGDVFISYFDSGNELKWSTFFGGAPTGAASGLGAIGDEQAFDIVVARDENLYIVGGSYSIWTPTAEPPQTTGPVYFNPFLAGQPSGFISRFDLSQITSIGEKIKEESAFLLYPNPVNNTLKIKFKETQQNIRVDILDFKGANFFHKEYPSSLPPISLDLEQLPSGVYFLKVQSGKLFHTQSFIKE